jgi:hypothetical protein
MALDEKLHRGDSGSREAGVGKLAHNSLPPAPLVWLL